MLETYIREADRLVHLNVNGEAIITIVDHPFCVDKLGFVNAGELWVGTQLLDTKGNVLSLKDMRQELAENSVTVYNFQMEGCHTYYVGGIAFSCIMLIAQSSLVIKPVWTKMSLSNNYLINRMD